MKTAPTFYENLDFDLTISTIQSIVEKKHSALWIHSEEKKRPKHGLLYILEGTANYENRHSSYQLSKDSMLYLPQGSTYCISNVKQDILRYILINFNTIAEHSCHENIPTQPISSSNTNFYNQLFVDILKIWFRKDMGYRLKCKVLLHDLLYHIILDAMKNELHLKNFSRIEPAVSYMEEFYQRQINMEELSAMVNLSVSRFRDVFKEIYGISPLKFLNQIRINKACDLLQSEMFSVTEVAEKTGFTNVYYFSRMYKNMTGQCPSASI